MQNTLSLCVICKNEEKNIGNLLESVKGDLFDEIIICDTGSQDATLEIVKKYKTRVVHFPWINDFSAARNHSFSQATMTYQMWLDSDDVIRPPDYQKLLDLKKKLHEYPMWLMKYEYAHDEKGKSICSFYRERIVRRDLNLKWQDPIHEYLPLVTPYQKVDIEIHHNKTHSSSDRNIPMLIDLVAKNPDNARNVYYLGKELFDAGRTEEALKNLEKFVTMPGAWSENKHAAYLKLIKHYASSNVDLALDYAFKALKEEFLKAEIYCVLGDIFFNAKNWEKAAHWYRIAANMERPQESLDVIEPKYFTWLPNLQLCVTYNSMGRVKDAAIANERALSYCPDDPRMLTNKKIFKEHLKEDYPQDSSEIIIKKEENNAPRFKIGWHVPNIVHAGTIRIRVLNVSNKLKEMGYDSELFNPENLDKYDFIIAGKSYSESDLIFIKDLKSKNKRVVCDLSEDILEFPWVKEILKEADMVICCSHELTKKVIEINKTVLTIEDATEHEIYG